MAVSGTTLKIELFMVWGYIGVDVKVPYKCIGTTVLINQLLKTNPYQKSLLENS